jgi:hypothetical protein
LNRDPHATSVPPNFGSGADVRVTQDGARRRAGGVTPLLPRNSKVVGATGFEPATPCAQAAQHGCRFGTTGGRRSVSVVRDSATRGTTRLLLWALAFSILRPERLTGGLSPRAAKRGRRRF